MSEAQVFVLICALALCVLAVCAVAVLLATRSMRQSTRILERVCGSLEACTRGTQRALLKLIDKCCSSSQSCCCGPGDGGRSHGTDTLPPQLWQGLFEAYLVTKNPEIPEAPPNEQRLAIVMADPTEPPLGQPESQVIEHWIAKQGSPFSVMSPACHMTLNAATDTIELRLLTPTIPPTPAAFFAQHTPPNDPHDAHQMTMDYVTQVDPVEPNPLPPPADRCVWELREPEFGTPWGFVYVISMEDGPAGRKNQREIWVLPDVVNFPLTDGVVLKPHGLPAPNSIAGFLGEFGGPYPKQRQVDLGWSPWTQ